MQYKLCLEIVGPNKTVTFSLAILIFTFVIRLTVAILRGVTLILNSIQQSTMVAGATELAMLPMLFSALDTCVQST